MPISAWARCSPRGLPETVSAAVPAVAPRPHGRLREQHGPCAQAAGAGRDVSETPGSEEGDMRGKSYVGVGELCARSWLGFAGELACLGGSLL